MSTLLPCRHLDYEEGKFGPDITLETCAPHYPHVKFWRRGPLWIDNGPDQEPNPSQVQFCGAGRGRINDIFVCYQQAKAGGMSCYEPALKEEKKS